MTQTSFANSPSGRLVLFTAALHLFAIGAQAIIGASAWNLWIVSAIPLVSIILCLYAVGHAVDREDASPLFLVIALPLIAGIAFAALISAPKWGSGLGIGVALAGVALMLIASGALPLPFGKAHSSEQLLASPGTKSA